ncbi:MAG: hypothetical protein IT368_18265, partial [Candidatus Hydrogenedentes bacterium]|nr:hypothetical protein [Candidatus Hydrogenedentota bacterium]
MRMGKVLRTGLVAAGLVLALAGCVQTRMVVTPVNRDTLEQAPEWARSNSMVDPANELLYFVGVSNEQVLSEQAAVDDAYKDAMRRAGDYIGIMITMNDRVGASNSTAAFANWPYRVSPHLNMWLGGAMGLGGFAGSNGSDGGGIAGAAIMPFWKDGPEVGRKSAEASELARETAFDYSNIVSGAQVVDTWATAERFFAGRTPGNTDGHQNDLRFGEVWKAKVLVCVPRSEMEKQALAVLEMDKREYELQ